MKSINVKMYGFIAMAMLCFGIFIFSNSQDAVMDIRIRLTYVAYFVLAAFLIHLAVVRKDPASFLYAALCAGAGYFLFHFSSQFMPSTIVGLPQCCVGVGSAALLWLGIHLFTKGNLYRMAGCGVFSMGIVFALVYILAFTMNPVAQDAGGVMTLIIVLFMATVLGVFVSALIENAAGRIGVYVFATFVGFLWIGSFWINVVTIKNVLYGGCWPSTPIGQTCGLRIATTNKHVPPPLNTDMGTGAQPSVPAPHVIVTPRVTVASNVVVMPRGGSLCGTLHMTPNEALSFAKENHLKHWYKNQVLYVLVFPDQQFENANGWKLVK